MDYLSGVTLIVGQTVMGLVLFVFTLRLALPLSYVRFTNPVCQLVYRVTNPIVGPLTRVLPNFRRLSIATLVVLWLASCLMLALLFALSGLRIDPAMLALTGLGVVVKFVLSFYFWLIVIWALMSFVSPDPRNPMVELLRGITGPVLAPFRNWPPRLEAIDLSPLWACLIIRLLMYTLTYIGLPGTNFF